MRIYFDYTAESSRESGRFLVDDNSSLYGLANGEQFDIQFNPQSPARYYCAEAKSLSQTIRRAIMYLGISFAVIVFLIELLARGKP